MQSIGRVETEQKVVIRLSIVKKWGARLNVFRTISNSFKVSLTKSFPVVQGEKIDRSFL